MIAAKDTWSHASAADITDTTATTLKAAAADTRYWITDVTISNMHATQGTRVDVLSGSTLIYSGPAAANGGGFDHSFSTPLKCGVNEAIKIQCGTAGAAVRGAVNGFSTAG